MHRLLERQLRKALGGGAPPAEWKDLLAMVDEAYQAHDEDRDLLERSMMLTSEELQQKNQDLRAHITELEAMQRRLGSSEAAYRQLIMTASEGIWTVDADGRIDFVNDTMCRALGFSREEMVGRNPMDFADASQRPADFQAADLVGLGRDRFELPMRRKDGSMAWMMVSSSPIQGEGSAAVGALAMFADITARKRAEDALRQAYDQLQRADSARQAFINAAAHELGTPLTPIRLQVHALKRQAKGELAGNVAVLERNVDRIIMLVNDLLDSAKIQAKRLSLEDEALDLSQLVEAAGQSFHEVVRQAGLTMKVQTDGQVPVRADRRRLEQVLDNLLVNAAKFTPRGGAIRLRAGRDGDLGWFEVIDTGVGIPREEVQRLFQPFSQLPMDRHAPVVPGTGLGLYICRGIMEAMGGTLTVQSAGPGKGATFRACMPLETASSGRVRPKDAVEVPDLDHQER